MNCLVTWDFLVPCIHSIYTFSLYFQMLSKNLPLHTVHSFTASTIHLMTAGTSDSVWLMTSLLFVHIIHCHFRLVLRLNPSIIREHSESADIRHGGCCPYPEYGSGWLPKFNGDFLVRRSVSGKIFMKICAVCPRFEPNCGKLPVLQCWRILLKFLNPHLLISVI